MEAFNLQYIRLKAFIKERQRLRSSEWSRALDFVPLISAFGAVIVFDGESVAPIAVPNRCGFRPLPGSVWCQSRGPLLPILVSDDYLRAVNAPTIVAVVAIHDIACSAITVDSYGIVAVHRLGSIAETALLLGEVLFRYSLWGRSPWHTQVDFVESSSTEQLGFMSLFDMNQASTELVCVARTGACYKCSRRFVSQPISICIAPFPTATIAFFETNIVTVAALGWSASEGDATLTVICEIDVHDDILELTTSHDGRLMAWFEDTENQAVTTIVGFRHIQSTQCEFETFEAIATVLGIKEQFAVDVCRIMNQNKVALLDAVICALGCCAETSSSSTTEGALLAGVTPMSLYLAAGRNEDGSSECPKSIFDSLHLYYESCKLFRSRHRYCERLAKWLHSISRSSKPTGASAPNDPQPCASVVRTILNRLPFAAWLNPHSRSHPCALARDFFTAMNDCWGKSGIHSTDEVGSWTALTQLVCNRHWSRLEVLDFSFGLDFVIRQAIHFCGCQPSPFLSSTVLERTGRQDLLWSRPRVPTHRPTIERGIGMAQDRFEQSQWRKTPDIVDHGVEVESSLFKRWGDSRLEVALASVNSSAPIQLTGSSDNLDVLQTTLAQLCRRSLALPVGRGMITLSTHNVRGRDTVTIPAMTFEGRSSDNLRVHSDPTVYTDEKCSWAHFHNATAAGLRFLPLLTSTRVARQWVVYQSQALSRDSTSHFNGRSGLLFAAGLLGHLRMLQTTDVYALLTRSTHHVGLSRGQSSANLQRDTTKIAVMLGLSSSFRGTGQAAVERCLTIHIQSLVPDSEDLETSLDVQTAALVALGLLHQGSRHCFLSEVFIGEMTRRPSDEHCRNREGYTLAAGFGLGLLLLGSGGIPRLHLDNRLFGVLGGHRRLHPSDSCLYTIVETNGVEGLSFSNSLTTEVQIAAGGCCSMVAEGERYNPHLAASAIAAITLVHLQTGSATVVRQLRVDNTPEALRHTTPFDALLRSAGVVLVQWPDISLNRGSLYSFVPSLLLNQIERINTTFPDDATNSENSFLSLHLGHCIAGVALGFGLKFAGTLNAECAATLVAELTGFASGKIGSTNVSISLLQKKSNAFEVCISVLATALSLVLAGTGDVAVLNILRRLLQRTSVGYGEHMAVSMAVGMLFLGAGRQTIGNDAASIAALYIAFFPKWPENALDNVAHLQAFRHLYVLSLAKDSRWFEVVDVNARRSVNVTARLVLNSLADNTAMHCPRALEAAEIVWTPIPKVRPGSVINLTTPCLLPDTSSIERLEIRSVDHYSLVVTEVARVARSGRITVAVARTARPNNNFSLSSTNAQLLFDLDITCEGHPRHWGLSSHRCESIFEGLLNVCTVCMKYFSDESDCLLLGDLAFSTTIRQRLAIHFGEMFDFQPVPWWPRPTESLQFAFGLRASRESVSGDRRDRIVRWLDLGFRFRGIFDLRSIKQKLQSLKGSPRDSQNRRQLLSMSKMLCIPLKVLVSVVAHVTGGRENIDSDKKRLRDS